MTDDERLDFSERLTAQIKTAPWMIEFLDKVHYRRSACERLRYRPVSRLRSATAVLRLPGRGQWR